jgi:heptosyltransferase-2
VLAPEWSFALLARIPEVSEAIAMQLKHGQFGWSERVKLGKSLRSNNYSQAILLPNSWKSALIPFFANIPKRTGYIGECRWGLLNDGRKLDKASLTMTVQRFVALGLASDAAMPPHYPNPALNVSVENQTSVSEKFKLTNIKSVLALCPGAEYGEAKRWPARHFAEVARRKIAEGWQVWLLGSAKDKPVAEQINAAAEGLCMDFTGNTELGEAVDLLSLADVVVSNDSGLMHVAAALDKKLIALYGSSDPGFTPPLNAKAHILTLSLPCSPCFKRECPLEQETHMACLAGIKPESVLELIG